MKAIWKFGPLHVGQPMKVMGRPIHLNISDGNNMHVWCEVDPAWRDLPNTKEGESEVEWHTVVLVPTGEPYEGKYLFSTYVTYYDRGMKYYYHLIEVER
ncbi:hypothetical protein UFOVP132_209 [uncultured Caudovirales phage]|uniref:Uncharacterized protein n=1 Tax=uncultured Caudovirales phage TaxID=2100421 RepID=A0A6J5LB27_9CAUD|nr:hypothetical protein UFOVP132_209 [uncultured Caudovirales phage]